MVASDLVLGSSNYQLDCRDNHSGGDEAGRQEEEGGSEGNYSIMAAALYW